MDGRRTSSRLRSSPEGGRVTRTGSGPKSPIKKSPDRKPSPINRKSPSRKASPGRRMSPSRRKSPARRASSPPKRQPSPKRRGRPMSTTMNASSGRPSTPAKEIQVLLVKEKIDEKLKSLKGAPTKDLKTSSSLHSVQTAYSSSTVTTTTIETVDVGSGGKPEDTSGDSEIAKLTSLAAFVRRSVSLAKNLTPTPTATTEQSRHSHSRSISRSVYEDDYSKTEYSDNEAEENYESFQTEFPKNSYGKLVTISRDLSAPKEFGAIFLSLFLFVIPAIVYYLLWTCTKRSCDFKKFDIILPPPIVDYLKGNFTAEKIGAYFAFTWSIIIFSAFPCGRIVKLYNDRGTLEFYFNSLAIALITTLAFGIGQFLGYPIADFILKNYLTLYTYSVLSAFTISIWCYVSAKYVSQVSWNPYAKSGIIPIDYAIGREVNPKWFGIIDIKLVTYRTALILSLLFAEIFLYKNIHIPKVVVQSAKSVEINNVPLSYVAMAKYFYDNSSFDSTSLLMSTLLLIYIVDWIYFEHHLAASFELQHEGIGGLLLLRYAITPFLLTAVPKYFFENQGTQLPVWAITLIVIIFTAGLILKRKSNAIKYRYRMNPQKMEFAYIDTVPTFQGKRLLLGSLWGRLRQPNYTGDILSLLAFAIPFYWKFSGPPLVCLVLIILNLFHRAVRVNKRNFARYDSAWTRYCSRARYLIVPKVF